MGSILNVRLGEDNCKDDKTLLFTLRHNLWDSWNDHVSALLPICLQLKELELIDDRKFKRPQSLLSDESIVFIANHCQDLKNLNISGHQKLTSKDVNEVLEKCPKL